MHRKIIPLLLLLVSLWTAKAQNDTVKLLSKGGFFSLTFNQVSLSNWAAGGEDALSATGIANFFANYKKGKSAWDNSLDLGYGVLKSGSNKIRKNEDKLEFNSKYGYQAFDHVYYSVLVNYRSQFAKGYNYPNDSTVVSKFNAPGYLSISIGMDYKPRPFLSIYLSPMAGRMTFVIDRKLADAGAYGVDPAEYNSSNQKIKDGKKCRFEFGATLSARYQQDVVKNVNIASKLLLFNNYTDKVKSNRGNIAVNWETMVNIKAGKYLTTSILTNMIYDQNVIRKTQFKEAIGVGLSYKF